MSTPRPIHEIEGKWQKTWEEQGLYEAKQPGDGPFSGPKFYGLVEFPFPSGDGLHVGHTRSYSAIDTLTRRRRMQGMNVMEPMGWDAFGLPTENFAIKHKVRPQEKSKQSIANFKRQLQSIGFAYDWSREVDTTDPKYYKWTQWQFLKFYDSWYDEKLDRARPMEELPIPAEIASQSDEAIRAYKDSFRLAYKGTTTINWCPKCKIGLANEEAIGGVCERCGTAVEKREKAQWMIRITKYAERLIRDLEKVDYLEKVKAQQIHWIGKSEGAYINFQTKHVGDHIRVFTTRPDTLFGVTYVVLSPEHALVESWLSAGLVKNHEAVMNYQEEVAKKPEAERTAEGKEKTGIVLEGIMAINPANNEEVPVWIADYVLANYGTGAVMAVPAHDERDFAFAKKYRLQNRQVVQTTGNGFWGVFPPVGPFSALENGNPPPSLVEKIRLEIQSGERCFVGEGVAVGSDFLNDLPTWKAKEDMTSWLEENNKGEKAITYRLRDWVFSRQRYWGEPIPMVHCERCGWQMLSEDQLPLVLPDVKEYEPTDTGESPLSKIRDWVETKCPNCGDKAERETDTMPNWAGSSWYFLRYCDPKNDKEFASQEALKYWMPVNLYNGGMEHTTLHLLYSRFWYKFLWDLNLIPEECGAEPYAVRRSHGLVLAEGGEKMSKSKGNVINPDDVVKDYGADAFRVYQLFMGPFDQPVPWDTNGIEGVRRFLDKVWSLFEQPRVTATEEIEILFNQTVKKIGEGIDTLQFNTCVSQLMILAKGYQELGGIPVEQAEAFAQILAPFAPHVTEEIWQMLGQKGSIHVSAWPNYDESKLKASTFELVIQVNGKVRDRITVSQEISEEEAQKLALSSEKVKAILEGKAPKQIKYIKGRLVTIAV